MLLLAWFLSLKWVLSLFLAVLVSEAPMVRKAALWQFKELLMLAFLPLVCD
jgi:hypothetical protein